MGGGLNAGTERTGRPSCCLVPVFHLSYGTTAHVGINKQKGFRHTPQEGFLDRGARSCVGRGDTSARPA